MEKSKLVLMSDDDRASNSKLVVSVQEKLDIVKFDHIKLNSIGDEGIYSLHPHQIKKLIRFLQEAEEYISSNYNPVLMPESSNEFENG